MSSGYGSLLLLAASAACSSIPEPKSPLNQYADGALLVSCVRSHWGEPVLKLAEDCAGSELPVILDIIADVELIVTLR